MTLRFAQRGETTDGSAVRIDERRRPAMTRRATRLLRAGSVVIAATLAGLSASMGAAQADSYVPISGAGSTWSQNAIEQWRKNVNQYGLRVNYAGTGSSDGRNQFRNGTVDFAVSEIPYGLKDAGVVDSPPSRKYAYMPIVAGGTSFMYNLKIGGKRVTALRLSGETIAKIFTGVITSWADPQIKKENPGLVLPGRRIVPVVRGDGSGTTAQFTTYLSKQYQSLWDPYCKAANRPTPCGTTSIYPVVSGKGFTAQAGSLGVSGYVSQQQNEGTITYVEYSYAINAGFPVVKLLNKAGYYVEPTPQNVAVGLLKAKINDKVAPTDPTYLTQDLTGVYNNTDARSYPLSSYSYMIIPTAVEGTFSATKGKSLGAFAYYFLCEGQQQAPRLGFSPLPINLVNAGLKQVKRIPGVTVENVDIKKCNNPTFSATGENTLAKTAPFPAACAKSGPLQCDTSKSGGSSGGSGSGGGSSGGLSGGSSGGSSGSSGGGSTSGGSSGGSSGGGSTSGGDGSTSGGDAGSSGGVVNDPDTGLPADGGSSGGDNSGGVPVAAVPVSTATGAASGASASLILLAGVVLLAAVMAPPIVSRLARKGGGA
jgi:phosphate ABC transporter phosphate-binding protein